MHALISYRFIYFLILHDLYDYNYIKKTLIRHKESIAQCKKENKQPYGNEAIQNLDKQDIQHQD